MKKKILALILAGTMVIQSGLPVTAEEFTSEVAPAQMEETENEKNGTSEEESSFTEEEVSDITDSEDIVQDSEADVAPEKTEIPENPEEEQIQDDDEDQLVENSVLDEDNNSEQKISEETEELEEDFQDGENNQDVKASEDLIYGNLKYKIYDGTARITGYDGEPTSIYVPAEIYGFKVTHIDYQAFAGCNTLTSISLSEGLEYIGARFIAGTKVTTLTVPSTVTACGTTSYYQGATADASYLEKVVFAEGMKKIPNDFCRNRNIEANESIAEVVIPNTVTEIGSYAFYKCEGLTNIMFGNKLKNVGYGAFLQCKGLQSIYFQDNNEMEVTSTGKKKLYSLEIGGDAFAGCVNLSSVILSKNVTSIGGGAFCNCPKLTELKLPEGLEYLGGGVIGSTGITSLTIPSTVVYSGTNLDGGGVTAGAANLKELIFEEGTTKILDRFCYNREESFAISKVVIPDTVTEIGSYAFYECNGLTNITFGKKLKNIGYGAFLQCKGIKNITFQYNDEQVTTSSGKQELYSLEIGAYAFAACNSLVSVGLSGNVTGIGANAFSNCTNLTELELPEGIKFLGSEMIYKTGITRLTIPVTVTSGDSAASGAVNLEEIIFEEGMTKIPDGICSNSEANYALQTIVIPDTVTEIGKKAFYNCAGIRSMDFGKNLAKIGSSAFYGCKSLEKITFEENTKMVTLSNGTKTLYPLEMDDHVFANCSSLTEVKFSKNVSVLGYRAFANCIFLEKLEFQNGLKKIGTQIVDGAAVTSLTIPETVTESERIFDSGAAGDTEQLKEVIFADGATTVPEYFCSNDKDNYTLKRVVIPATVTSIGNRSFYRCKELTIYGEKDSYAEEYAREKGIIFSELKTGKITRYDTAKKILDRFPTNKLLNDVSIKDGKITGPEVTVAGKTFALFEIDAGMDMKLSDKVQARVDMDTKTVQVLIGFKDFSGAANISPEVNSTKYWSESYKQVKNIYTGMTGKNVDSTKLWNEFSKLRGKLKKNNMKMAINAKSYAAGYMEFSFASGDFNLQEGGIILEAGLGVDIKERRLSSFPAAYCTLSVDTDFNGKLQFVKRNAVNYSLSLAAQLELATRLGVGLGYKKASNYVEGSFYGKMNTGVNLPATSLEEALNVTLSGTFYIESKVLGFDGPEFEHKFPNVQIYPQNKAQSLNADMIFDANAFSVASADRSYLESGDQKTELYGNKEIQGSIFEKEETYPYSEPGLVQLDNGTKLMIWIDDDGTKNTVNKTSLFASVYSNGKWSQPENLYESGGINDYPDIYTDGKTVRIVWQRTVAPLASNATLIEAMKAVDLYCITYKDGGFSKPELISNSGNEIYEMMQKVTFDNKETAVVWVENSANDPFMSDGTNSVKIARNQGKGWKQLTIAEGTEPISSVDISYVNGIPAVLYETYGENVNMIHLSYNGKVVEFSGNNSFITEGMLYYMNADTMCTYDISSGNAVNGALGDLDNFTVVCGKNEKYLLSLKSNGYTNELYAALYDSVNNTWGNPVAVTDYGKYIRSYSAQIDDNGNLTAAVNVVTVDKSSGKFTNEASLIVARLNAVKNISISGVSYDDAMVKPGQVLPVSFTVINNSLTSVERFNVKLTDTNGKEISKEEISSHLEPGASAEASCNYVLPEKLNIHKVTLTASVEGETDFSDNSQEIVIGYGNLVLDNLHLTGIEEKPYISGVVSNRGYGEIVAGTITVYANNSSGKLLGTVNTKKLDTGEQQEFSVEIPAEILKVSEDTIGNVIYVSTETDSMETDISDNNGYLVIDENSIEKVSLNYSSLQMNTGDEKELRIAYTGKNDLSSKRIVWTSSNPSIASVENGKVTALSGGTSTITATVGNVTAKCKITVSDRIKVSGVKLNDQSIQIVEGNTYQLKATVLPENAENKKITWSASDEKIAAVDENGLVTGIAAGSAQITVTTDDGEKESTCAVTVTKDKTIEYTAKFRKGDGRGTAPADIKAVGGSRIILPENTFTYDGYQFAGWSDGNGIYQSGFAYRMPYGDMIFTAQWKKPTERKNRNIVIDKKFEKQEGDKEFLLNPAFSEGEGEFVYSSDSEAAVVDKNGKITICKAGKALITIISPETEEYNETRETVEITIAHNWGGWKKTSEATVLKAMVEERCCGICGEKESRESGKPLTATLKLNVTSLVMQTGQKTTGIRISGLAKGDSIKSWKSSNVKVVKVSGNGILMAQKTAGKATITVSLKSGKTGKITVFVQKAIVKTTGISGLSKKVTLAKGKKVTLKPILSPITAQEKITYKTSNKKIADVSSKGVVLAKGPGTAKITVTSGKKKVVITVSVLRIATKSISGIPMTKTLKKGNVITLKPKRNPLNSDDPITYSSSNKRVAIVNKNGKITAKSKGTAVITIKSGKKTVRCKVIVK